METIPKLHHAQVVKGGKPIATLTYLGQDMPEGGYTEWGSTTIHLLVRLAKGIFQMEAEYAIIVRSLMRYNCDEKQVLGSETSGATILVRLKLHKPILRNEKTYILSLARKASEALRA
ncbi:MAG: hypothetical protein UW32_C0003G0103 [Candidatus Wolfebacteria bacterium GW2011_GWE2_44_13]|uniref:Uncharacterized protein n=1 Tax=Candidatus Wolfebacteria bacterium GW2011_GWE2_44_13 TaxID=1619017 RepID=A0A0G1H856_9BACT|nr:MAG: hypothetical protein UW32_C0003G0103 [Candidatus Wolfebacteria bacterium GW2011_GWE2_44_13]